MVVNSVEEHESLVAIRQPVEWPKHLKQITCHDTIGNTVSCRIEFPKVVKISTSSLSETT